MFFKNIDIFEKFGYNNIAGRNTLYTRVTEFTFKRHIDVVGHGAAFGGFFIAGDFLNIFVYSDESGVFDKIHNDKFVFGGLIFLGKDNKDIACRKYSAAEKSIYKSNPDLSGKEIKASGVSNSDKNKLYRSLNNYYKFGVVVDQLEVLDRIFTSKKDKQRYLDYAYKIGVKHAFKSMIGQKIIDPDKVENIYFFVDEHTTATNGRYELREALEQELKSGTYNHDWRIFYEPVFTRLKNVDVKFCNSSTVTLVRAADIIANKIYYISLNGNNFNNEISRRHMYIKHLPK